ncbi:MAG: hypothetical protein JHC95_10185 [Solirubrobacteraceae bacterium]|nr:hypothetical protein [Solirubrobacteraceae bacterium]
MAPELLAQLEDYYADDPNVKVIVDRRISERRTVADNDGPALRVVRDRRRPRVVGEFPPVDPPAA